MRAKEYRKVVNKIVCGVLGLSLVAGIVLVGADSCEAEDVSIPSIGVGRSTIMVPSVEEVEEVDKCSDTSYIYKNTDPNNCVYPYSMISMDWEGSVYEQGFSYYNIPTGYQMAGGMFPEVAQIYLWNLCRNAGVDYYIVLALIERESGYKYNATGDSGRSKGLMQIQEEWHIDRMKRLCVYDLYDPYANMRVGVDFFAEIYNEHAISGDNCVLMVYNMGYASAKALWDEGIYSTEYSRHILQRAQELKQGLQDY
jgi:hypothetical protein